MKRTICLLFVLAMLPFCCFACGNNSISNLDNAQKATYSMEDFSHIIPGESGIDDLLQVGPCKMIVMSYGGLCIYPSIEGKCIKVVLLGDTGELIVHSVEYAEMP